MTPYPMNTASPAGNDIRPVVQSSTNRHVCVIGLGYIGLPTAAMFAACGLQVTGVDVNPRVIAAVKAGKTHIVEPGLEELVGNSVLEGRLEAANSPSPADAFVITVPTPVRHDDQQPDMTFVDAAASAIARVLRPGNLVILESTSPVGATRRIGELMAALRPDLRFPVDGEEGDVDLAYSPERVIPGHTLVELRENSRVVGGVTPRAAERAAALYRTIVQNDCLVTDDRTAEMVKLIENSFRDVNVAFANELSMICDDLGLDVWKVVSLANRHPRVSILQPGAGVGGHCIAVDPWFVVASAPDRAHLIRTARNVNDAKPNFIINQVEKALSERPTSRVACFGLTFKPNIDDFRESPALKIAHAVTAKFPGRVMCADPFADAMSPKERGSLSIVEPTLAIAWAEVILMLVGHTSFTSIPPPNKTVIDACGFWSGVPTNVPTRRKSDMDW